MAKLSMAEKNALAALFATMAASDQGCVSLKQWERIARLPATRNNLRAKGLVRSFTTYKPNLEVWITLTDDGVVQAQYASLV